MFACCRKIGPRLTDKRKSDGCTGSLRLSEPRARSAKVFAQGDHVGTVRANPAGVNGQSKALGLLDAQAGIVELREAVTFGGEHSVTPGHIYWPRRTTHIPSLAHQVKEVVPISPVPHVNLPYAPV